MHLSPYAMAHELPHDTKSVCLTIVLDSIADVAYALAYHSLLDTEIKRLLGVFKQLLQFGRDFSNCECIGGITAKTVE